MLRRASGTLALDGSNSTTRKESAKSLSSSRGTSPGFIVFDFDPGPFGGVTALRELVADLLPKPTKAHHRTMIATTPRTPATISFFFSPGLVKFAVGISVFLICARGFWCGALEVSRHI